MTPHPPRRRGAFGASIRPQTKILPTPLAIVNQQYQLAVIAHCHIVMIIIIFFSRLGLWPKRLKMMMMTMMMMNKFTFA